MKMMMLHLRPAGWGFLVFAAVAAAGGLFVVQSVRVDVAERRRAAEAVAARAAQGLEQQIFRSLSAAYALAAAVRQRGSLDDFDQIAAEMVPLYGGIASLQLAPGGVVRRSHPPQPGALGHDLFADPKRRAEAERTLLSRQLTLAGPFPLRQGGVGMVGRYPVFRLEDGRERFWGFVNVLLRLEDVLAASRLEQLAADGFHYELARQNPDTGATERIAGAAVPFARPVRMAVEVPNGRWSLAVAPVTGWYDRRWALLGAVAVLALALGAGAATSWMAREPERLRALVAERAAELSRTEEQLRQAQKMEAIGLLAGGVAHDFNNLLTGILSAAIGIAEDAARGSATEEAARTIERAAVRAADLTKQLLGFARRGKLLEAPVDLHAVVSDAARFLVRTLDPGISISTRLLAPGAIVLGDSAQLHHAILNLAVNARDAMPDGGTLIFETAVGDLSAADLAAHPGVAPGPFVALSVADTGVGIPPAMLERIFEPFFTTKEPGRGTGMGLAMVYGVARNHGGFVEVKSTPGKGARFTIHLPRHRGAGAQPAVELSPPPAGRGRLLVVDDQDVVRRAAVRDLAHLGYDPVPCGGGDAAVEYLREHVGRVDLAIVDIGMPGMDGLATFHALREVDRGLRVVVISGYGRDRRAQEILDAGAVGFVQKPWTSDELATAVRRALTMTPV